MAKTEFKIQGLKRWKKALSARGFDEDARAEIRKATALNGKVLEAAQRRIIQEGTNLQSWKKNAALTQMIKKSSKPLVDHGGLFQAITSKVIDDFTVFAGVLRTDAHYDIAKLVHEGKKIKITPRMRNMFYMLHKASVGQLDPAKLTGRAAELWARAPGGWLPIAKRTRLIVIPPRRWINIGIRRSVAQCRKNWKDALDRAFAKRAKQDDT